MRRRFVRARKPEEKEVRRQAILKAAREMLGEVETSELSLNELARRSGVSKPNIYRYFESREEVLLQVWIEEVREFGEQLRRSLATIEVGDSRAVASAIVAGFGTRPILCELTSICASVLERNLSADAIVNVKQTLATLIMNIAGLLRERLPALDLEDCAWVANVAAVYVAGIWPAVHPPAHVAEVLKRPEFAAMQPDFEKDFTRYLNVLFAGLQKR
ncbi:TetR/AcrR family transcriptional regulator [Cystobacter ferrugineus]|uniref:HTH tetR-type domain-containing protein n=1 Tax=Cystobacter ferrugineus TaxID=83449 RepID=A0A1L9AVY3_9BACT|nr:TetR family transcriptional regulator [Cystobacter ferrugineus]OJH34156.1 hypothetical protein BON30_45185 [Cystobacter ferrugineus]